MMTGFGMGFGWFGFLMMAIFWIAIIAAAVWFIRNLFPQNTNTNSSEVPDTPLSILKKRYARGEISREEYEKMRLHLE